MGQAGDGIGLRGILLSHIEQVHEAYPVSCDCGTLGTARRKILTSTGQLGIRAGFSGRS